MNILNSIESAAGNVENYLGSFLPSNSTTYTAAPATSTINPQKLASSIAYNETRGEQNPYSFKQYSGSSTIGNANGKYQITDAELKAYAPRFLGTQITPQQFLNNPSLQDRYINTKIQSLANRRLTPEQILAVHRGGMSDLTPQGLSARVQQYQPYVTAGMNQYNATSSPQIMPLTKK